MKRGTCRDCGRSARHTHGDRCEEHDHDTWRDATSELVAAILVCPLCGAQWDGSRFNNTPPPERMWNGRTCQHETGWLLDMTPTPLQRLLRATTGGTVH